MFTGVVPVVPANFLVSRASGRSNGDEKLSNRRLSQFDPYGTRFQLFIFEAPAVIPNRPTGSTFLT